MAETKVEQKADSKAVKWETKLAENSVCWRAEMTVGKRETTSVETKDNSMGKSMADRTAEYLDWTTVSKMAERKVASTAEMSERHWVAKKAKH